MFLVNIESVMRLALVKYMLCSHFTQNCILYFLEAKNPYFETKNCWKSSYICVFILSKKRRNFTKTFITQEWLVVESCPTPRWIAFLMLYRLVYNIRSHFNELILVWSAYNKRVYYSEWSIHLWKIFQSNKRPAKYNKTFTNMQT